MSEDLQEETRKLLDEPLLGEQGLDAKIRRLLEAEYMRRLLQYRRVDRILRQKHGTTFEDFIANRVVRQEGYNLPQHRRSTLNTAHAPAARAPSPRAVWGCRHP